ncbi:hypothetical protein B0H17DRAFT_1202824 [Mycena rosella]|uniref:Uncharacterized protein n=1 Tax=Mycena rosella TaxID=1033263 RepID=A0AAD7GD37_MYCRO|nr:hypothetical protein B0H17DRAFT_1202824 [Mycena rosella]
MLIAHDKVPAAPPPRHEAATSPCDATTTSTAPHRAPRTPRAAKSRRLLLRTCQTPTPRAAATHAAATPRRCDHLQTPGPLNPPFTAPHPHPRWRPTARALGISGWRSEYETRLPYMRTRQHPSPAPPRPAPPRPARRGHRRRTPNEQYQCLLRRDEGYGRCAAPTPHPLQLQPPPMGGSRDRRDTRRNAHPCHAPRPLMRLRAPAPTSPALLLRTPRRLLLCRHRAYRTARRDGRRGEAAALAMRGRQAAQDAHLILRTTHGAWTGADTACARTRTTDRGRAKDCARLRRPPVHGPGAKDGIGA